MKTASENVIRAVARVMTDARAGDIAVVGIVSASPDGQPYVTFAGETELLPSLNLAIDMLKANLLRLVSDPQAQPITSIVRPAGGSLDS